MAEQSPGGNPGGGDSGVSGNLGDPGTDVCVGCENGFETVPGSTFGTETKEEMATRWAVKNKAVFVGVMILTLLAVR